ncbi:unnamed protein product, partial [Thelazia callipaeda]|uniref:Secreted protein n=1 Tax=Thelazia callipaeda TaxID=103827 RepID=A0A0N5CWS9_THECL
YQIIFILIAILFLASKYFVFTSQTYPDPRIDAYSCRVATVGAVCDPAELIVPKEREALAARIKQLMSYAATVPNTSPACQLLPDKSLDIIVGVIDKIGTVPIAPVDIEKFTNNLKSRYQHYQDASLCDTMVLIVNSKSDRQVFTVAGKDTKLTKEILKSAFEQNINYFRANNFAAGLQGIAEFVTKSYRDAHLPRIDTRLPVPIFPERPIKKCGKNPPQLVHYVQAVVEEAMSFSLRLISDQRYSTIEEDAQGMKDDPDGRVRAWNKAKVNFIDQLYQKYYRTIRSKAGHKCPARPHQRLT